MPRAEFSTRTKLKAWERCQIDGKPHCECGCGLPICVKGPEYDHRIPCALGGDNSLGNCVVMRKSCHDAKTREIDAKVIAKSRHVRAGHAKAKVSRSPLPGGRKSKWKKKLNGEVVPR